MPLKKEEFGYLLPNKKDPIKTNHQDLYELLKNIPPNAKPITLNPIRVIPDNRIQKAYDHLYKRG